MHEKTISKSGINEITKVSMGLCPCPCPSTRGVYSAPTEPPAAQTNVLMHVGLWALAIKVNPS